MTSMRCLYLDMNAFFASVEQQVNPRLRGRPVAITALQTGPHNNWAGAVVTASYEAKAQGVKAIMRVCEARQICPDILFIRVGKARSSWRFFGDRLERLGGNGQPGTTALLPANGIVSREWWRMYC